jgi:hypothetical protein
VAVSIERVLELARREDIQVVNYLFVIHRFVQEPETRLILPGHQVRRQLLEIVCESMRVRLIDKCGDGMGRFRVADRLDLRTDRIFVQLVLIKIVAVETVNCLRQNRML